MSDRDSGLEAALVRLERDADRAMRAAAPLIAQLKRAKRAAAAGNLRDLEKALESAESLAASLRDAIRTAKTDWTFPDKEYLESGAYTRELLEVARDRGLALHEQGDRLASYPSLVRILPGDAAIEVDRKRVRAIRPTVVVETLKAAQARPPRFRPQAFLEALLGGYKLVIAEQGKRLGETVRLVDVHRVLTVLPGQSSIYSRQEFARDLYLLDESGLDRTRDGLQITLPAATGTRVASALTTVMKNGQVKLYYGVAFRE